MFKKESNEKIGAYLTELINRKFKSTRQFCKAYIKLEGRVADDSEIRKMSNRLSQIKKGTKAIQIYDLEYFTQLLDVTCEELLSAGNCFIPDDGRMTNYKIVFTEDRDIWERYIHREDEIFLHADEYHKTVIDYALEYKRYDFLKYLMDNDYIWFVGADEKTYFNSFGAGTSIKRTIHDGFYDLDRKLASEDKLRRQMISLAIEHNDFEVLTELRAREIPSFYHASYVGFEPPDCFRFYDENLVLQVADASKEIIEYFSQEFEIKDRFDRTNTYMFPYMSELIKLLIEKEYNYLGIILKRCIKHNRMVYCKLNEIIATFCKFAFEEYPEYYREHVGNDYIKELVEKRKERVISEDLLLFEDGNIIRFWEGHSRDGIMTNIFSLEIKTKNIKLNQLIEELNNWYNKIVDMKPKRIDREWRKSHGKSIL